MKRILLPALLVFACGGEQSKPADPQPQAPADPAPVVEEPGLAEIDAGQTAPDDCVAKCVASRQMQATSIEQIEADCKKHCAGEDTLPE